MIKLDIPTLNAVIERMKRIQSAYKVDSMGDLVIDGLLAEIEDMKEPQ
jgi:hypothetical protein